MMMAVVARDTARRGLTDSEHQVFLILGNHELYGSSYSNARRRVAEICAKRPNLHLLDRNSYLVPGTNVRIIGATLVSSSIMLMRF